jgi:hypothetical protein
LRPGKLLGTAFCPREYTFLYAELIRRVASQFSRRPSADANFRVIHGLCLADLIYR